MRGTWGDVREAGGVSAELLVCPLNDEEIQGLSAASASALPFSGQTSGQKYSESSKSVKDSTATKSLLFNCRVIGL